MLLELLLAVFVILPDTSVFKLQPPSRVGGRVPISLRKCCSVLQRSLVGLALTLGNLRQAADLREVGDGDVAGGRSHERDREV